MKHKAESMTRRKDVIESHVDLFAVVESPSVRCGETQLTNTGRYGDDSN